MDAARNRKNAPPVASASRSILIVDDDTPLLAELDSMLSAHGDSVTCTGSAEEGVEAIAAHAYDFVLLDYRMPGKNGSWFMRHASLADNTKVLLLTAFANRQVIDQAMRLGASGYVIKPVDEDELLAALDFHLPGRLRSPGTPKEEPV